MAETQDIKINLGRVTAYGYAKSAGYDGTPEEFAEEMANGAAYPRESKGYMELAESFAHGTGGIKRDGDDTDNAKYYSLEAKAAKEDLETARDQARGAAADAQSAAQSAADSAASSATQAAAALASADAAASSASAAADSASTAAGMADASGNSATAAAGAASDASYSALSASASADAAAASRQGVEEYEALTRSYAVGTGGEVRQGDNTDNAKYYKEQAEHFANVAEEVTGIKVGVQGNIDSILAGNY